MHPEDIEVSLLLEGVQMRYGYDFRGYSRASVKRRMKALLAKARLPSFSHLQHELLHRPDFFAAAMSDFTVTTSEMFRDPSFFRALREQVVPVLRTYPSLKIWHAGCSTGEEVYSLAILLKEEGLYDRCVIYATDINQTALKAARDGIYPADSVRLFTANYQQAGGTRAFSDYYSALYGGARLDPALREAVVFTDHNLVTDDVFSETQLILCRNVLIYFNRELQSRVLDLFTRSLAYKGFLCLGSKETVAFIEGGRHYRSFVASERIYQAVGMQARLDAGAKP
jgi:chemotaxis protein methyltransferase CheR